MTSVGTSVVRPDVAAKITGAFTFSNDVTAEDVLYGATVRSPHPHARIRSIDPAAAIAAGARCVLTAADVPGDPIIGHISADQPVFAIDEVNYAGEPVAFVVADTQDLARRVAELVDVVYEVLPAVTDPEVAAASGSLFRRLVVRRGPEELTAQVEVEGDWSTGRQDQLFLAPESALASPDPDGGVTLRLATQDLHTDHHQIVSALAIPPELVRLEMAGVGGAFGGREDITLQVHLALAALVTGRPVKTTYRRPESFLAHPKRHPARLRYRVGADRDGTLRYVWARILLDGGAYASTSQPVTGGATYFAAGPYRVDHVDIVTECARTNNPVSGAMRGFGSVQACFGIESTLDLLAAALGMDPVELRRHNALRPGDRFPTSGQLVGPSAPVRELIDACVAIPPPEAASLTSDPYAHPGGLGRTSQGEGVIRATGFALGVKSNLYGEGTHEEANAAIRIDRGGATVLSAASEVGQGVLGVLGQIAADELGGLPVRIAPASSTFGYAGSSSASRASWMSGAAVQLAAAEAATKLREHVAAINGFGADAVELRDGFVVVEGEKVALAEALGDEVVEAAVTYLPPQSSAADPATGQGDVHVGWMFVAHRATVDVDTDLGLVRVVQMATAQDVGRALNPREVRGQIDGGIAQGLGFALSEELLSDGGVVLNNGLADYLIPTIADVARTEAVLVEVPEPKAPLGLKGAGEPASLSSSASIASAVRAATGARAPRLPIRPQDLVSVTGDGRVDSVVGPPAAH